MKKAMKKIIAIGCVAAIVLSFAACGKKGEDETTTAAPETTVVETTVANGETTTAGAPAPDGQLSNSSTKEQVAAYYNKALNDSKAKNSVKGTEQPLGIQITDFGGLSDSFVGMINNAVPGIVKSVFTPGTDKGLPVVDYSEDKSLGNVQILPEDIKSFNVVDNGSTIELTITPETVTNPVAGKDAQGRFFQILGDVQAVVNELGESTIKFNNGIEQGLNLTYQDGTGKIVVDKTTGLITSAEYKMHINLDIKDAKALKVISVKKAAIAIDYITLYK